MGQRSLSLKWEWDVLERTMTKKGILIALFRSGMSLYEVDKGQRSLSLMWGWDVLEWTMTKKGILIALFRSGMSLYEVDKGQRSLSLKWGCTKHLCCHLFFLQLLSLNRLINHQVKLFHCFGQHSP